MPLPIDIAWALDVVIRVSLVLASAMLVAAFARRDAARRHAILLAGLGTGLLLPLAMATVHALPAIQGRLDWLARMAPAAVDSRSPMPENRRQKDVHEPLRHSEPPDLSPTASDPHSPIAASPRPSGDRPPNWTRRLAGALSFVVLLVAFARIVGLGLSLLRLRQLVAKAKPVRDERTLTILASLELPLATRRPVQLLESDRVSVPVAAGVSGPYMVLPRGWSASLESGELQAVLRHEFAHLLRRDHWVVLTQELLAALLWFNPFVHRFNRMLDRAREEVCDNFVLGTVDRLSYCTALLRLATNAASSPRGAIPMWTSQWSLEQRVQGILDERRSTRSTLRLGARWGTNFAAALLGCVVAIPIGAAGSVGVEPRPLHAPARHAASAEQPLAHKTLERSFSPKPGEPLRLENLAGRVELVAGLGKTIEVAAMIRIGDLPPNKARALIDEIEWIEATTERGAAWGLKLPKSYGRVRYPVKEEVKSPEQTTVYLGRSVGVVDRPMEGVPSWEVDLRIAVPAGASLELHNAVGPVEGADLAAALRLNTVAGCIQVRNVQAPLIASSDAGDVMIHRSHSDVEIQTNTGNIELSHTEAGRIVVASQRGGCRILQPASSFRVRNAGPTPIILFGSEGVRRTEVVEGRRIEWLSHGSGGPEFDLDLAAGECTIEAAH